MTKFAHALVLVCALAAPAYALPPQAPAVGAEADEYRSAAAEPVVSTCAVWDARPGRNAGGSGTSIACEGGKSLVLSCNHIFADQVNGRFVMAAYPLAARVIHNGKTYPATAVGGSDTNDLAYLVVDGEIPPAELAEYIPKVGSEVRHFGQNSKFASGVVLRAQFYADHVCLVTSCRSESGDSGAGLFANFSGRWKLIGVNCGRTSEYTDPQTGELKRGDERGTPLGYVYAYLEAQNELPRKNLFGRLRRAVASWRDRNPNAPKASDRGPPQKTAPDPGHTKPGPRPSCPPQAPPVKTSPQPPRGPRPQNYPFGTPACPPGRT